VLLADRACRQLVQGDYRSVTAAAAERTAHEEGPLSREQVGEALRRLELAGVIETHKAGLWTLKASELRDVLEVAAELPAGVTLLDHLAHPVGWSVIARLSVGDQPRSQLRDCGEAARVSEQVHALRQLGVIADRGGLLALRERERHLEVLDRLDRIAGNLHMRAFERARDSLFDPIARASEGTLYASAPAPSRSSENRAARKAYNYTRAALQRSRSRR
jgi:hypothetical protein